MKTLLKLALIVLAARVLAGTPRGSNQEIDAINDCTVRDIAGGIMCAVNRAEEGLRGLWSEPEAPPPKGGRHRVAAVSHRAGSR